MLIAAIGCCLAWAIIDATFYLLNCFSERRTGLLLLRRVRTTTDPVEARRTIAGSLPPLLSSHLHSEALESLRVKLTQLPEPAEQPRLTRNDWLGALAVLLLCFGSILPVVIPFTIISDARQALRVSNGIVIVLLFLAGYALGRHISEHPLRVAVAMVVLGSALVGIAIAFGG